MSDLVGGISGALRALKQNPNLEAYVVHGEETVLLCIRNNKLRAKRVATVTLKRNPGDDEIDAALIHRHTDFIVVEKWNPQSVLNPQKVLDALSAKAA